MGTLFGLIIFIVDILAIIEIIKGTMPTTKKIIWSLIILILPLLGLLAYLLIIKKKA